MKTNGYMRKAGWCPEGRKRVLLCLSRKEFDVSVLERFSTGGMKRADRLSLYNPQKVSV